MASPKGRPCWSSPTALSTIQNADQIVVLEKGHIVDQGTQAERAPPLPALPEAVAGPHLEPKAGQLHRAQREGQ
ncbi:MAG: hypothetical protein ACLVD8_26750 [Enterocloster sp.]|uniref:hypothetical protein n=1 Tax=Enterocloster sp. TaxID=2719315 RepID=UPI00399A58F9